MQRITETTAKPTAENNPEHDQCSKSNRGDRTLNNSCSWAHGPVDPWTRVATGPRAHGDLRTTAPPMHPGRGNARQERTYETLQQNVVWNQNAQKDREINGRITYWDSQPVAFARAAGFRSQP
eukprot:6554610-Lingulodinium_polyedra.AAC.1